MLIDTHAHIFKCYYKNPDEIIKDSFSANIGAMIMVGYNLNTSLEVCGLINKEHIYGAVGVHPSEANRFPISDLDKIEKMLKNDKIVAIGECGIDLHYPDANLDKQKVLFEKQIALSITYDKPLIIHMRDATEITYEILKKYDKKIKGVMHCYTGSYEMALKFIELGFYISLAGPITFKNANEARRVAEKIDVDYLLIETDSPYLAPDPHRGKDNHPGYLRIIFDKIATIRNMNPPDLERNLENNANKIFQLKEKKHEKV